MFAATVSMSFAVDVFDDLTSSSSFGDEAENAAAAKAVKARRREREWISAPRVLFFFTFVLKKHGAQQRADDDITKREFQV